MPTETTPVVLLFEDDRTIALDFDKRMKPKFGKACELKIFPLDEPPADGNKPYDERVEHWIRNCGYYDRIVLIVTDRDLSANSNHWSGLSQTAVSGAARQLGLPVAGYRRAKPNTVDGFKRIPGDGLIDLDPDIAQRASQVGALAKGFVDLQARMQAWHEGLDEAGQAKPAAKAAGKVAGKSAAAAAAKPAAKRRSSAVMPMASPGALLAGILGQPTTAGHFDTFACGDQVTIGEILSFGQNKKARMSKQMQRRLVSALGVWLTDLVMKYPGVLVNQVAAASYLDIHTKDFAKPEVQKLFQAARYAGLPFEDDANPLWWRHLLDERISDAECTSGLELCHKEGHKKVRFCPCDEDDKLHAGYYCMATNTPLSAEKSSGRVRWFPPGADLARLKARIYRKLAPWIG